MTIKQLGKDLVALGEMLQRDDWALDELAAAGMKCGMRIGIGLSPIEQVDLHDHRGTDEMVSVDATEDQL